MTMEKEFKGYAHLQQPDFYIQAHEYLYQMYLCIHPEKK